jgi:hypothetical protein
MYSSDDSETSEGLARLGEGSRLLGRAAVTIGVEGPLPEAERQLRAAMSVLRSAMNWLEDTEHFELAHQRLDASGRLSRERFPDGCAFAFRDGQYFQECPAALAHNRVGMSPGYVIRAAECSICHRDPDECDHVKGRLYDGERCVRILTELDLLEVSVVGRPAPPDARFHSISLSLREMREELGTEFTPGLAILCDRCLSPCRGVSRPFEAGGALGQRALIERSESDIADHPSGPMAISISRRKPASSS